VLYLSDFPPNAPANAFDELTAREREFFDLMAHGYTNARSASNSA
jgi:hypothetical protein